MKKIINITSGPGKKVMISLQKNKSKSSYAKGYERRIQNSLPPPQEYYSRELKNFYPRKTQATALCPFHNENNPSLSINLSTGKFHCFGCDAYGGSIISFRMQLYQETYTQAIRSILRVII